MAETTGLLNRRTGHSVPRVRISSSPQKSLTERSVRDFWLIVTRRMAHFCRKCIKKVARRRVTFGEGWIKDSGCTVHHIFGYNLGDSLLLESLYRPQDLK